MEIHKKDFRNKFVTALQELDKGSLLGKNQDPDETSLPGILIFIGIHRWKGELSYE
jgi:hypothetical protein